MKQHSLPLLSLNIFLEATWINRSVVLKFGIIQGSFWLFYTLTEFSRHLMCIIQIWTTGTCSSAPKWVEKSYTILRCMLRSHARNGNEFQTPRHRGSTANVEILGFEILVNPKLIWNSWDLACYHGMVPTCCGKKFVPFGAGFGISFSQTRGSHKKPHGSGREHVTFVDETTFIASSRHEYFSRGNMY
jgi:hypothetical protein